MSTLLYCCPYPGCNHMLTYLTKLHCQTHHMERKQLLKKYGDPVPLRENPTAHKENMKLFNRNVKSIRR